MVGPRPDFEYGTIAAGANHRAAGPLPLSFEIRKRETVLKVGKLECFEQAPGKKKNLAALIASLVEHDGDGKVVYDPPLADLEDKPGDFKVTISVAEGERHKPSVEIELAFKIFLSHQQRNEAFQAWKKTATQKQLGQVGNKQQTQLVGFRSDPGSSMPKWTSADQIRDALSVHVKADIPTKDQVWAALGHDLKGKADWIITGRWETSRGVQMHRSISYNSIRVPQTRAAWADPPATLYSYMFEGPPHDLRVHMTLEKAATEAGKIHVYAGNTNGKGKPWQRNAFSGQVGEMIDKLAEFKAGIVASIPAAKTTLKVP